MQENLAQEAHEQWQAIRRPSGTPQAALPTVNALEALERITRAITWLETSEDLCTVIHHKYKAGGELPSWKVAIYRSRLEEEVGACHPKYRPDKNQHFSTVDEAIAAVFAKVSEALHVEVVRLSGEVTKAEKTLAGIQDRFDELHQIEKHMGTFNPNQQLLPFTEGPK